MSDKILKLEQAQTLYEDLRERIDALPTSEDIPAVPVQDVQVNGVSVLNQGVANVPYVSANAPGVVNATGGALQVVSGTSPGCLYIRPSSENGVKRGTSDTFPLAPSVQHLAVFYGLAKAAGTDMKDIASTTVGTYPDAQKAAIQNMLGITDLISTEESTTATTAHAINSTFMMNGKLHRATAAIAIGDAVEVGANCEVVKADEVFVKNTDYATSSTYGLIKISNGGGLKNLSNGLGIDAAISTTVKAGSDQYRAIVPIYQHHAVYYGLSKLAGVDLASETVTVGTYPETSKTAIRTLIGAGTPLDVQINGTSIVNSGIANIPVASSDNLGIVCVNNASGVAISSSNNRLFIKKATDAEIKAGSTDYKPIVASNQHLSTFYGLAKAAGDTTQSVSDNAVGTYTDGAKAAIKSMLGITHTLTVTILTQDNVTVTGQTVTVRADDANGEVYATAAYEGQPVSFSVPDGFQYYVSVSDTLAHHFNPTTASGIITNTDVSVTLQYSDFSTIRSARDIKAALNAGMDLTDLVGEQITCSKGDDTLSWDVVDYDSTNGTIILLLHDAFGTANMVFEPAQALMWCENGLAAGSYTFADGSTHYYFTTSTALPAGGQLRATDTTYYLYASQASTGTLETGTVSTTEIAGATDLGTCAQGLLNHMSRVRYGSNNFAESALFGWLNSDAVANTPRVPVTKFSRAYSYAQPGFMNGLDADFVNCLDEVDWLCSTNNVYECPESLGGYTKGIKQAYTVKAKFALASEMEIFGSYGGNADGSTVFDLYNGADADDRKKYRGTSAQVWWLRSPYWSVANNERSVYSSGSASYYYATNSYAVVPACRISRDTEVNP